MSLLDRKHDFADPDGVTYLNCAYQGPMPKVSLAPLSPLGVGEAFRNSAAIW